MKDRTMDNVQDCASYINIPSSQTYRYKACRNGRIVSSNSTGSTVACGCLFCVCAVLRVGSGFAAV
jgi:hypothetical protein